MFAQDKGGEFLRRPDLCPKRDQKLFVIESPMSCGSVTKTFVVKLVSALFRNPPVIAVVLNTFFT